MQPPAVSVIGAPVMAATCSTVSGHRLPAFTGAGAEPAGADAAGAAAGASALLSPPLLQAAIDIETIPAHIQPNSPDLVITVPPAQPAQGAATKATV